MTPVSHPQTKVWLGQPDFYWSETGLLHVFPIFPMDLVKNGGKKAWGPGWQLSLDFELVVDLITSSSLSHGSFLFSCSVFFLFYGIVYFIIYCLFQLLILYSSFASYINQLRLKLRKSCLALLIAIWHLCRERWICSVNTFEVWGFFLIKVSFLPHLDVSNSHPSDRSLLSHDSY